MLLSFFGSNISCHRKRDWAEHRCCYSHLPCSIILYSECWRLHIMQLFKVGTGFYVCVWGVLVTPDLHSGPESGSPVGQRDDFKFGPRQVKPKISYLITSLAKEVMFLVALVSLSVCLSVDNITQKVMIRIGMKFYGRVLSSTRKNWLNFGGDLGILRWVNEQKNTVIVVAYPDRGAGNDPEPFFFFFFFRRVGSLSQPRLNIFTVGNMRVMICLGQGGLRSLSASSVFGSVG